MRIGRVDNCGHAFFLIKVYAKNKARKIARLSRVASRKQAFKRYTEHKSETAQGVIVDEALRETGLRHLKCAAQSA
jgi:hypothetical protein